MWPAATAFRFWVSSMPEVRSFHGALPARRPVARGGETTRLLGIVLAAALAAAGLAAVMLASGGGLLVALLCYSFGASFLVGTAAVAGALREAGLGRAALALMRRSRPQGLPS
jgi:hypothetical protein